MFEKCVGPRIFGLPPGVNFSRSFVSGLKIRLQDSSPEILANVQIYVNSKRMLQKVKDEMTDCEATMLPKLSTLNHLDDPEIIRTNVINPLGLRLELAQLISKFIELESNFGSQNSCFDLADSLATLIQELHEEGLSLDSITELDLEDYSEYWQRNKTFFILIRDYLNTRKIITSEQYKWRVIDSLEKKWAANPPSHPIMIVGSTGSKGTNQRFIKLISNLPQGAVILPGVDFDIPKNVWDTLGGTKDSNTNIEDHPQYRLKALTSKLDITLSQIRKWTNVEPSVSARNKLISLSMQPSPVTDTWLNDGPKLKNIDKATSGMTVLEAPSERVEALAISMGIRRALEDKKTCLVITPNRILARKISAALKQWGLDADDAAGVPISLSVIGRLFLKVSNLIGKELNTLGFIELLKHPLICNEERGLHLKNLRALEITFLRGNLKAPNKANILEWVKSANRNKKATEWVIWVFDCLDKIRTPTYQTVREHLQLHIETIHNLINGPNKLEAKEVWKKPDGKELLEIINEIEDSSKIAGLMDSPQYSNLIFFLLKKSNVRTSYASRADVMIWGTQETRVSDADIIFLAGLNEGVWPPLPTPDPWINRPMRKESNLLLPERLIGLSAHDFQQAIASKEVWLTRSTRDSEAETLPSRWLNRLFNLLEGLSNTQPSLLNSMKNRGQLWLDLIENYEKPKYKIELAKRPSPIPPIISRPKALQTQWSCLINTTAQ